MYVHAHNIWDIWHCSNTIYQVNTLHSYELWRCSCPYHLILHDGELQVDLLSSRGEYVSHTNWEHLERSSKVYLPQVRWKSNQQNHNQHIYCTILFWLVLFLTATIKNNRYCSTTINTNISVQNMHSR